MHHQSNTIVSVIIATLFLGGCAKHPVVQYDPSDFVNPNRVIVKKQVVSLPKTQVHASFGVGNAPEVVKAYNDFSRKGQAKTIQSSGFITLPYDSYSHPIIACAPLHLCVVQLERGEKINNIDLGDSAHWLVSTARVGTLSDGSYQIAIKPKVYDIATDMVITTNKRTYNIGLVSKQGEHTHVTNFYYPRESLSQAVSSLHQSETSLLRKEVVDTNTHISLGQLNFDYQLKGDSPVWRPLQVFDDGNKTYIRMPSIADHTDLPVLYIVRDKQMELVNYRYHRPYYIIDALFKRAVLVSGKGHTQVKVIIDNHHFY